MAFFSKLAFWKRKDDLGDLGKDFGLDKDLGMDLGPSPDLGMGMEATQQPYQKYPSIQSQQSFQSQPAFQSQQSFQPQPAFQQPSYSNEDFINSKNLEVISSKLDAVRASLESINQRLANLEAIARGEQEDYKRKRYY